MIPNILLYTIPPNTHSGGNKNFFLFFEICKKKNINIFLCPVLKTIPSLNFYSPFDNKSLDEITEQEINNYFKNNNSNEYNLKYDIVNCDIVNLDVLRRRDNIVIYSEDVVGNPAEQKYVVRWLHFFPHINAIKTYSFKTDYICFFSDFIFNLYDNLCKNIEIYNFMRDNIKKPNILRVFHFKKDYYKNFNKNREGNCFLVRKCYPPYSFRKSDKEYCEYVSYIVNDGKGHGFEHVDSISTHDEMISSFNNKCLFLSFDPFTFTSIIASLCGCNSVISKIPNLTKEEWQNSDPFNKYGIAYGMDDIEESIKTRDKLEEHIYSMYLENDANVDKFIESIKEFFNFLVKDNYMERWFFDTFGYTTVDCNVNRSAVIDSFEKDIETHLNLPSLNGETPILGQANRKNNIRFSGFESDRIYSLFYNPSFLYEIYKLTDDFVVLSPMESFYLNKSGIHRDLASELKQIKILLYLDDLSSQEKGPLYILPGTHNLYDKYSSSIGENVAWPPPDKGGGANFCGYNDKLNDIIPKTFIFSNLDKIIMFNHNLFHGSDGNLNNPAILRRCIGMTIICIDRTNKILMKKVENLFYLFNVDNSESNAYNFCKKHNLTQWLKHFYIPEYRNKSFQHSSDGTDGNALILAKKNNRWKHYLDYLCEPNLKNKNLLLNCFDSQVKAINNVDLENPGDHFGL
jgi:hypothetical protein